MSSVGNKNAASAARPEQSSPTKSLLRKWVERLLMLSAFVGTIAVLLLYGDLITRHVNPPLPKSTIYGKWVEQDVAPYAREVFILSERGVTVRGSIVATDFEFDGDTLSYKIGAKVRQFNFLDQHHSEIKLDSNAHYLPVFHLEGHSSKGIR